MAFSNSARTNQNEGLATEREVCAKCSNFDTHTNRCVYTSKSGQNKKAVRFSWEDTFDTSDMSKNSNPNIWKFKTVNPPKTEELGNTAT